MEIRENMSFDFKPAQIKIDESKEHKGWLQIGGVALTEGVSENNNVYKVKNLQENAGKNFKWVFGHPERAEDHVIGMGKLFMEEGVLRHEGKIRNTVGHPDVVEQVRDGFLEPSIHAKARKVVREGGKYHVEGLSIDGVGLVAFKGVKDASIDYAIAESFDKFDRTESGMQDGMSKNDDKNKDTEVPTMAEEVKEEPKVDAPVEEPKAEEVKTEEPKAEPADEQPAAQEPQESVKRIEKVEEELNAMKLEKKQSVVESIVKLNKNFKAEELIKESDAQLAMRFEYEKKLSKTTESAIVESAEVSSDKKEEVVESEGSVRLSESAYNDFNKELRERVR